MNVQGRDCSVVVKTKYREIDVPYSEETLREAVSLLVEAAAIEGDGICKALRKVRGVTGCVVTPLTIKTAPLFLYLVFGATGFPLRISETRNLHSSVLTLLPLEDSELFDLVQNRGNERRLFEACRIKGFELRIKRGEVIKLKLDVYGERAHVVCPYNDVVKRERGERFNGDCVTYKINGKENSAIYGVTLVSRKEGGTRTELWIRRVLESGENLSDVIEDFSFTAQLLRDSYESRHFGTFTITLKQLVLTTDETNVNSADAVLGSVRYYVAGSVTAEVYATGEDAIA